LYIEFGRSFTVVIWKDLHTNLSTNFSLYVNYVVTLRRKNTKTRQNIKYTQLNYVGDNTVNVC